MNLLLLEKIYNIPDLKKVDDAFDYIIQNYDPKKSIDSNIKKQLKIIESIVKKIFNVHCKIFIDVSLKKYIRYGMAIYPSYQELKGQIQDAIEDGKKGFRVLNCHNVSIEIESNLIKLIKKKKLSGRHMTAILLHELGHKTFVESQYKINRNTRDFNNKVIFSTHFFGTLLSTIVIITGYAIIPIISLITLTYLAQLSFINYVNIKGYSKSEGLSDSLPVKYGYGEEIYVTLKCLEEDDIQPNSTKNTKIKLIKNIKNNFNYFFLRRKNIIEVVEKEFREAKSPQERKILRELLADLKQIQEKDYK